MNGTRSNHAPRIAILYVDDAETERMHFAHVFGEDYSVLPASGAQDAIALLRGMSDRVGIVIADATLPGLNGSDLLRQVGEEFPHVIRILATGNSDSEALRNAVNSGEIFRIIEKPMNSALVAHALRQATARLHARDSRHQRLQAIEETMTFLTHELNTPLAAILNFARGMQRRLTDVSVSPQQQAEIWKASLAVDENVRLCIALLSSFDETIKAVATQPGLPAKITAHQLLTSLLDTHPLTRAQRGMIRIELEEDFPITALPNCISLVLSSLLNSTLRALKDTSAPSISLTVTAGDHPHIRIANNGPGLSPSVLDRLMLDSVATHADADDAERGLAFCKRIMQVFGGELMIRSVQGVYTTITLYFPAASPRGALPY
ncbi:MAG TPA: hybrid sensor histidine kinase/response regulator [Gallionellaceae bacterium]